jgi:hypothetical protein
MSVYSANLFTGDAPTSTTLVYTSPSGIVTVVRDLQVFNGNTNSASLYVYSNVSGSNLVFAGITGLAANAFFQWTGRAVIPPGNTLSIFGGVTSIAVMMSGYQLGA